MNFELFYSLAVTLSVTAGDHVWCKYLSALPTKKLESVLRWSTSVYVSLPIGFGYVLLFFYAVPQLFDFELHVWGLILGTYVTGGYGMVYREPLMRRLIAQVADMRMGIMERNGERVAGLSIRRLSNHVPWWSLSIPYALIFACVAYIYTNSAPQNSFSVVELLVLVLIVGTVFLHFRMTALIRQPIDLRSREPEQYQLRQEKVVRKCIRGMLIGQLLFVFTLSSLLVTVTGSEGSHLPWKLFTAINFFFVGYFFCFSIYSARIQADLNAGRWLKK